MFDHRPKRQRDLIARIQTYPPEAVEKAQRALGQCVGIANMPHSDQGLLALLEELEK